MLAPVGFAILAVLLGAYAVSSHFLVHKKSSRRLEELPVAYGLAALACAIWAVVSFFNHVTWMQVSIFFGDSLMLAGTCALIDMFLVIFRFRELWLVLAVLASLWALMERVSQYPPAPYLSHGVFVFNSGTVVWVWLAVVLALVWLPTGLIVARVVLSDLGHTHLMSLYASGYVLLAVATVVMVSSTRTAIIIGAMVGAVVSILALIGANMEVARLEAKRERQTRRHHPAAVRAEV